MEQRLISHNHANNKGYTARFQPWVVIYQETYPTKKEAMSREKQLKSAQGRKFAWQKVEEFKGT